jgi:hypothetical protein
MGQAERLCLIRSVPEGNYKLRLVSVWDPRFWIESPEELTITGQAMTVSVPAGTRVYHQGDTLTVNWTNAIRLAGTSVRLELWNANGFVALLGNDWNSAGQGQRMVKIPYVPTRGDYRVRSVSVWNPALWAQSETAIAIQGYNAVQTESWQQYQ